MRTLRILPVVAALVLAPVTASARGWHGGGGHAWSGHAWSGYAWHGRAWGGGAHVMHRVYVGPVRWAHPHWGRGYLSWRANTWIWVDAVWWATPVYPGWIWIAPGWVWDGEKWVWQEGYWAPTP